MGLRPCIECGALTNVTRCPRCLTTKNRERKPRPTNLTRDTDERQRRAAAVAQHRQEYGNWCPGWKIPPHAVAVPNILTADHVVAVAAGGDPNGELQVLCRVCNGRKADR
jgi:5-methylcytosine-specific restriction protein A